MGAFLPALSVASVLCIAGGTVGFWRLAGIHPLIAIAAIVAVVGTGFAPVSAVDADSYAEIFLDSAVLVTLGLLVPPAEALVVFTVGQLVSMLALRSNTRYVVINLGLAILGATSALAVLHGVHAAPGSPGEILAVVAMSATYAAVTLVITSISQWSLRAVPLWLATRRTFRLSATVGALVIDSLGYLAAVLTRTSVWALLLMAGPVALLTLTSRVLVRAQGDRARLRELVRAADLAHASTAAADVVDVLVQQARAMLRCDAVELRDVPPEVGQCGALLTVHGVEQWLVASPRLHRGFDAEDDRALHALVRMAQAVLTNRELLEGASYQALHDSLTGLANRALFSETVAGELRRAGRTGHSLAVVFLDLDGFKPVNDELGHEAGDELLVETARRLEGGVRAADLVARVGGDEFCVLLSGVNTRLDAVRVADGLCQRIAAPYPLASGVVQVCASAGIAMGPDDADDASQLMRLADRAMYVAKRGGSGGVVAWSGAADTDAAVPRARG